MTQVFEIGSNQSRMGGRLLVSRCGSFIKQTKDHWASQRGKKTHCSRKDHISHQPREKENRFLWPQPFLRIFFPHDVLPLATGSCQHNPPSWHGCQQPPLRMRLVWWAAEYHPRVPKVTQTESFDHCGKDSSKHPPKERNFRTFGEYSLYMLLSSSKSSACLHCWFEKVSVLTKNVKHIFDQADGKNQMAKHDKATAMNCRI